jgi:hypothetical protein
MSQADRPKPFAPHGAVDGFVVDSTLAKQMKFIGRFGNSCGMPFVASDFCDKHIQYNMFRPYLKDRPSQPWTEFSIYNLKNKKSKRLYNNKTKKNKKR